MTMRKLAIGLAVAVGAIAPASAQAGTTWFGSSLNHEPANAGSTCVEEGQPLVSCTRVGSYYPGNSGRVKATRSGRITKIRLMAQGPGTLRVKIVRLKNVAPNHKSGRARVIARTRVLHVNGPVEGAVEIPIEEFAVNLAVRKGDSIAIDTKENVVEYCSDGTPGMLQFRPVLPVGGSFRPSSGYTGCLLLVQARVRF